MSIWKLVENLFIAVALKIVLGTLLILVFPPLLSALYMPWVKVGLSSLPCTGPGSHAMISPCVLLAVLIGFFVYSSLIGMALCVFRRKGLK